MPPKSKSISLDVKRHIILNYIRSTGTCHTLKDLEKTLPSIASINSIQVKEFITGFLDDNQVRLEKIGSNNWYWSFLSDEKREHENAQEKLFREVKRITEIVERLENELRMKEAMAQEDEGHQDHAAIGAEREHLTQRKSELLTGVEQLQAHNDTLSINDVASVQNMIKDICRWKIEIDLWTDNIYIMEQYLEKLASGDRELVEAVKRHCYGDDDMIGDDMTEL